MTTADFLASLPAPLVLRGDAKAAYVRDVDIAKRIRAELSAAIAAGVMPVSKWSVRCNNGGHSRSLTVEVLEWRGGAVLSDARHAEILDGIAESNIRRGCDTRSPAFQATLDLANAIANRHNYDESDLMTDYFCVGYYLNVEGRTVEVAAEMGAKLERDPALADLILRAKAAAEVLGEKETKKIMRRTKIDSANEFKLRWLIEKAAKVQARQAAEAA